MGSIARIATAGPARASLKAGILAVAMLLCGPARADAALDDQVRQLDMQLARVRQEQQAIFQNFQMGQEMRRAELAEPAMPVYSGAVMLGAPLQNYDDNVRAQRERQERLDKQSAELRGMYARNLELEEKSREMRARILELQRNARE